MRLLIYLLALMGGFSAADAARADLAQTAAVAQTAVAVADALVAQEQANIARPVNVWPRESVYIPVYVAAQIFIALSPITRCDVSLQ